MAVTYTHFDTELTQGWGTILPTCSRAHYWLDPAGGTALCGYRQPGGYQGHLRAERGLRTDCKPCKDALGQDGPTSQTGSGMLLAEGNQSWTAVFTDGSEDVALVVETVVYSGEIPFEEVFRLARLAGLSRPVLSSLERK